MVQRFYEAPLLLRLTGRLDGKCALEIGCGQGFGMEIILRQFGAEMLFVFSRREILKHFVRRAEKDEASSFVEQDRLVEHLKDF